MYISLHYLYRDASNYKRFGSVIFSNSSKLPLQKIESIIHQNLIDGQYFVHTQWGLPDLHFEKTDWKMDHDWHEYSHIEAIDHATTSISHSIEDLLDRISGKMNLL